MPVAVPASTTFVPGQMSLGSMKKKALSYISGVQSDPELNEVAACGINSGIARINSRNWHKIYSTVAVTLTADTSEYALPTNYRDPIALFRLNSSSERDGRIDYKTWQTLVKEHPIATVSDWPRWYSIKYSTRQLVLVKPPSSSFVTSYPSLEHWFHARQPELTQDGEVLTIPPEFGWYLIWEARVELAGIRAPGKLIVAQRERDSRWDDLRTDDNDTEPDWSVL